MLKPDFYISRRDFLLSSAGSLAALALTRAGKAENSQPAVPPGKTPIIRTLGRTGLVVPIVNAGGGPLTDPGLILACYDTGLRLFDTDARYQNGRHEEMLGRVFNRAGIRDKVFIMTKVHTPEQREGLTGEQSKRLFHKTLEGCLSRLKTNYVDILLVHDVSDARTVKDAAIIDAITMAKAEGKTRYIGLATHTNMAPTINAAVEAGVYDVVLTTINFTFADDTALLGAIERAARAGVGIIAMKTQAGGFSFPNPSTLRDYPDEVINSAALKWVCHNEHVATSIPGIQSYQHLRADYAVALNPEYTDEEKRLLSDNRIRLGLEFCRQCRKCVATCPHKVDIPTLMRTHMYAKQYTDFELAHRALESTAGRYALSICSTCPACRAECAHSVNICRKIEELKLIYA